MDLKKFVSLLEKNELFFSSIINMEDEYEGSIPLRNAAKRFRNLNHLPTKNKDQFLHDLSNLQHNFRSSIYINCWHLSQNESVAMWKIYSKNDEGIAIKTNISRLKSSITDPRRVFLSKVNYIDYSHQAFSEYNALPSVLHKRKEFAYENELRLLTDGVMENHSHSVENKDLSGINIKVDINNLIDEIYISPFSVPWLQELVSNLCKQYSLDKCVMASSLNVKPIF